jgi:hypothetical protein
MRAFVSRLTLLAIIIPSIVLAQSLPPIYDKVPQAIAPTQVVAEFPKPESVTSHSPLAAFP